MSDAHILGPNEPGPRGPEDAKYTNSGPTPDHKTFPWERVAFTIGFAFVAWFAFWGALILALVAIVIRLTNVKLEADIAGYARVMATYLGDVLGYIGGSREEKPFPFSPLTKSDRQ